jgi:hypothetical protein
MIELANGCTVITQYWMALTSALLIIAFVAGNELDKTLRRIVLAIYLMLAFSVIVVWCNHIYGMFVYGDMLSDMGVPPNPHIPVLSQLNIPIVFTCFLGGTIASALYFKKKCQASDL